MRNSQKGWILPIVLLYLFIFGLIMYILIASVIPLADKKIIVFFPKPPIFAASDSTSSANLQPRLQQGLLPILFQKILDYLQQISIK